MVDMDVITPLFSCCRPWDLRYVFASCAGTASGKGEIRTHIAVLVMCAHPDCPTSWTTLPYLRPRCPPCGLSAYIGCYYSCGRQQGRCYLVSICPVPPQAPQATSSPFAPVTTHKPWHVLHLRRLTVTRTAHIMRAPPIVASLPAPRRIARAGVA